MKWIPCEERLPNDNREVLISLEWGIDIGTYERGEWRSEWINHYDDDNVLAWMPLPQPYTADRKTEPQTCSVNGRPYDCGNCEYHKCTADVPQAESLEQFRVGLEYHTDTTHFGKVKGESITTNRVEGEPQTNADQLTQDVESVEPMQTEREGE